MKSEGIFMLATMFAFIKCQTSWKVFMVYNRDIIEASSEILDVFSNLGKISENDRKHSYNLQKVLGEFSKNFENHQKSQKIHRN